MVAASQSLLWLTAPLLCHAVLEYPRRGQRVELPIGPWVDSARDVSMTGNRLCAVLRKADGTLSPQQCLKVQPGQAFDNDDGRFQLHDAPLPGGDWIDTSRNAFMDGYYLCTELMRLNSTWTEQVCIEHWEDKYYINDDGQLRPAGQPCYHLLGQCVHGYVLKRPAINETGTSDGYKSGFNCMGTLCKPHIDRDRCCDATEHCFNITTCSYGLTPDPVGYCQGIDGVTECDEEMHRDECCVPAMPCRDIYLFDRYFCLDPEYSEHLVRIDKSNETFCASVDCITERDVPTCCQPAAPCTTLSHRQCPNSHFFNTTYSCGGLTCDEERDRMVCCQQAQQCSEGLVCPFGFLFKTVVVEGDPEQAELPAYCDGRHCELGRDQSHCCDASDPCPNLACPHGTWNNISDFCGGVSCDFFRDSATCCLPAESCAVLESSTVCPHGDYFNSSDFCFGIRCEESDKNTCCQTAAPCFDLGSCPHSYVFKPHPWDIYVPGWYVNMTRDRDSCCDAAAPCSTLPLIKTHFCEESYVIRNNALLQWGNPDALYCNGTSCVLERDRDECCAVAAPCSSTPELCPHGMLMYPSTTVGFNGFPGAYCAGEACDDVERDRSVCCFDAMPCETVVCPHNHVVTYNQYCGDLICEQARDIPPCCERGVAFSYFKFSVDEVRVEPNDPPSAGGANRQAYAEMNFYWHNVKLSWADATASAPDANSPSNEGVEYVIDGTLEEKFNDRNRAPIFINFTNGPIVLDGYAYTTANDGQDRDPTQWRLQASQDGVVYVLIHDVTDGRSVVPLDRFTEIERMPIRIPCLAPEGIPDAASPSCPGGLVTSNENCVASCNAGFTPSISTLACNEGVLTPASFTCSEMRL